MNQLQNPLKFLALFLIDYLNQVRVQSLLSIW
jgi:hypothetical protein